ncbi:AraC family transcriptional regulator [Aquabacterium soli]|nr:AraC family transcriptional regulator [Aquabacterium soli]
MQTASHAYALDEIAHIPPLTPAPQDTTMVATVGDRRFPPSKLATLLSVLLDAGVDPVDLLEGTGLTRQDVENPFTLTSCAQFMRATRNAVKLYPGWDLGLRVGMRLRATNYGMYGYALLCSETVQQMWNRAIKYHPLSSGMLPLRWCVEGPQAVWTFPGRADFPWPDVDERLYRFMIDLQFAAHVTIGRDVMGPWFLPCEAAYVGSKPVHAAAIEAVLQCPVRFDQPRNTLSFPTAWLDRAPQLANPITASHVSMQCARLLDEFKWSAGITRRVYQELTRLPGRFPDIEEVAQSLCMTSRTLRRRLEAEGASYTELLTAVRKTLAIDYLTSTLMSAEDIAEALGFSDVVSFRHAFKRWTGATPKEYRKASDGGLANAQPARSTALQQ